MNKRTYIKSEPGYSPSFTPLKKTKKDIVTIKKEEVMQPLSSFNEVIRHCYIDPITGERKTIQ